MFQCSFISIFACTVCAHLLIYNVFLVFLCLGKNVTFVHLSVNNRNIFYTLIILPVSDQW